MKGAKDPQQRLVPGRADPEDQINVGDQPTALSSTQPLTFFDLAATGAATFSAITSSNPAATCSVDASGANFVLNSCFGNLAPGQA